jgi:hypothetical protein
VSVAAVGFRAKTARAIVVALTEPLDSPGMLLRDEIKLSDPAMPATLQPYHEVMELPWRESQLAVRQAAKAIEAVASSAVRKIVRELRSQGFNVCAIGVVGSADRDLARIGNPHIRAHAAEGILFRHVFEVAAKANRLPVTTLVEKGLTELAASELRRSAASVASTLKAFGRVAGPPWRADERAAALAAWMALTRCKLRP